MDRRFQYVSASKPIWLAHALMLRRHVNYLVVSETGEDLDGLVTHADVFRKMLPTTAEYMERPDGPSDPQLVVERYREISSMPATTMMELLVPAGGRAL